MATKTKEDYLMSDAEVLGIPESPQVSVQVSPEESGSPEKEVTSVEGEVVPVEVKAEVEQPKSELPKPADALKTVVSPLELIKLRKTGNPLCSVSELISSRRAGGKTQQSVQDLIASRKSGQASGVTAMDIIAERKYSPKRQVKVL